MGRKFLAPPYHSQHAVFASPLSAFFIVLVVDSYRCFVSLCQFVFDISWFPYIDTVGWRQEGYAACKNSVHMLAMVRALHALEFWLTPPSPYCSSIQDGVTFWYWLTQVVEETGH